MKDEREHRTFKESRASETSADEAAIAVTHDPNGLISGLTKIAAAQAIEVREQFHKLLDKESPEDQQKSLDTINKGQREFLEWRIAGIRKAVPR